MRIERGGQGRRRGIRALLVVLLVPLSACASATDPQAYPVLNTVLEESDYTDRLRATIAAYDPDKVVTFTAGRWHRNAAELLLRSDTSLVSLSTDLTVVFIKRGTQEMHGTHFVTGTFLRPDEARPPDPDPREIVISARSGGVLSLRMTPDTTLALSSWFSEPAGPDRTFLLIENNLEHPAARRIQAVKDRVRRPR